MSFRESLSNFFSYVLLIGFVIAVGAGGIYLYKRSQPEPPPLAAADPALPGSPSQVSEAPEPTDKPLASRWLRPMMTAKLPVLFKEPDGKLSDLGADFSGLEAKIQTQKNLVGRNQPAWNTATALCREIRAIALERNAATAAMQKGLPTPPPASVIPHSKADMEEQVAKQEFFKKAAQQRWLVVVPARKKKIEILYRQLLAEEAAAIR